MMPALLSNHCHSSTVTIITSTCPQHVHHTSHYACVTLCGCFSALRTAYACVLHWALYVMQMQLAGIKCSAYITYAGQGKGLYAHQSYVRCYIFTYLYRCTAVVYICVCLHCSYCIRKRCIGVWVSIMVTILVTVNYMS